MASTARIALGQPLPTDHRTLLSQTIVPAVCLLLSIALTLFIRRIFDTIMNEIQLQIDVEKRRAENSKQLMETSSQYMTKVEDFRQFATATLGSSKDIEALTSGMMLEVQAVEQKSLGSKTALDNILTSISDLTDRAENQAAHVAETVASIEEMNANIQNITSISEKKKATAENLYTKAKDGEQAMDSAVKAFDNLSEYVDGIIETTDVMKSIASQTNLLAMNAAITTTMGGLKNQMSLIIDGTKGIRSSMEDITILSSDIMEQSGRLVGELQKI